MKVVFLYCLFIDRKIPFISTYLGYPSYDQFSSSWTFTPSDKISFGVLNVITFVKSCHSHRRRL